MKTNGLTIIIMMNMVWKKNDFGRMPASVYFTQKPEGWTTKTFTSQVLSPSIVLNFALRALSALGTVLYAPHHMSLSLSLSLVYVFFSFPPITALQSTSESLCTSFISGGPKVPMPRLVTPLIFDRPPIAFSTPPVAACRISTDTDSGLWYLLTLFFCLSMYTRYIMTYIYMYVQYI